MKHEKKYAEVHYKMLLALQIVFIVLCVVLIGAIMFQHRKKGGFSGSFGAGTQLDVQSGSWQRMTQMTKLTVILTAVFMIFSLALVYASSKM